MNDKLLHHNNALIKNTEDLFDQLSQYKSRETITAATPSPPPLSDHHHLLETALSTMTKERDLLKEEMSILGHELHTLRADLKSAQASSEAIQISTKVRSTESIGHERLHGSSLPSFAPLLHEDADLPGVHSGWGAHHLGSSPAAGDFDDEAVKSQVSYRVH